jgi:hypothetical protein
MARNKNLIITITRTQSGVECAEWKLQHHYLQASQPQHERKDRAGSPFMTVSLHSSFHVAEACMQLCSVHWINIKNDWMLIFLGGPDALLW